MPGALTHPQAAADRRPLISARQRILRALFLGHRWAGIAMCLLFVMWFASGMVMMYVPYPELTETERLAGLETIDPGRLRIGPAAALAAAGLTTMPRRLKLGMLLERPVYRLLPRDEHARWITVFADNGARLKGLSTVTAAEIAARFAADAPARAVARIGADQWTVTSSFIRPLRALVRVDLADVAATSLYVSTRTGEVVRDTTRRERIWNWFGAVPHWIYFTALRERPERWHQVVVWVSSIGIVSALTGIIIGVLRFGWKRYHSGRRSPYRGWKRWHHVTGLLVSMFVLGWIVSGLLSMNPGELFSSSAPSTAEQRRYAGRLKPQALEDLSAASIAQVLAGAGVKEIELRAVAGQFYWSGRQHTGEASLLASADAGGHRALPVGRLIRGAAQVLSDARIIGVERLERYDLYYYAHHDTRPLPILRVRFGDPGRTWLHIDPATGELLARLDASRRAYRWAFNAPHSLDLPLLIEHRPAWDIAMITLLALGLLTSASAVVLAWRRLAGKRRKPYRIEIPRAGSGDRL